MVTFSTAAVHINHDHCKYMLQMEITKTYFMIIFTLGKLLRFSSFYAFIIHKKEQEILHIMFCNRCHCFFRESYFVPRTPWEHNMCCNFKVMWSLVTGTHNRPPAHRASALSLRWQHDQEGFLPKYQWNSNVNKTLLYTYWGTQRKGLLLQDIDWHKIFLQNYQHFSYQNAYECVGKMLISAILLKTM